MKKEVVNGCFYNDEIMVGEYIRNNKGNIGKVIGIFNGHSLAKYHIEFQGLVKVKRQYLSIKTIKKHSFNIIDLVEEGDYVNGQKIVMITKDPFIKNQTDLWTGRTISFGQDFEEERFINNDIKSIVTKERFDQMQYIV